MEISKTADYCFNVKLVLLDESRAPYTWLTVYWLGEGKARFLPTYCIHSHRSQVSFNFV